MKVTWDESTCIHAGECVTRSPEVFKIEDGQFNIYQDAADDEEIRNTVAACPSGALKVHED